MMEFLNEMTSTGQRDRHWAKVLLQLLTPFAPFVTQELWERIGEPGLIVDAPWPVHDPSEVRQGEVTYIITL